MYTFKLLLVIHCALLYVVLKYRWWIVRRLIGGRTVVANVTMKGGAFHIKAGADALFYNSTFEGPLPAGALFKVEI